ncbi:hypothetical protein GCM10010274_43920 [Streptomyces lavendofoliae]|uniref:Uncharacterized protein n=1 Tax=Streptomyces lavendofoliae TaxID=67314 RepID=A0A918I154_9ACTN|nr:hypothetical protein GCM10010274_43920 [Streptomyces lavendofoliae]
MLDVRRGAGDVPPCLVQCAGDGGEVEHRAPAAQDGLSEGDRAAYLPARGTEPLGRLAGRQRAGGVVPQDVGDALGPQAGQGVLRRVAVDAERVDDPGGTDRRVGVQQRLRTAASPGGREDVVVRC